MSCDRKSCDTKFTAKALFDHTKSLANQDLYHKSIYHYIKSLYCDNNGTLRETSTGFVGTMYDLHYSGEYDEAPKKKSRKTRNNRESRKA